MLRKMLAGLGISILGAALVVGQGAAPQGAPAQGAPEQGAGAGRGAGRGAGGRAGGAAAPGQEAAGRGGRGGAGDAALWASPTPAAQKWIAQAKQIAGNDPDLQFDAGVFCQAGRGASNENRASVGVPNSEPKLQPYPAPSPAQVVGIQRMFDNFYWVGNTGIGAWIITSDDGYIVYDAMNSAADARDIIVPAMQKAGLNPKNIKFLVFGHYHGDHTGGGRYLQQLSGAKAIQHWSDWDLYEQALQQAATGQATGSFGRLDDKTPMTRDIEATDGMEITIGNQQKMTVTLHQMTGHTPGSMAMIVPVRYQNREHPILIITAGQRVQQHQRDASAATSTSGTSPSSAGSSR